MFHQELVVLYANNQLVKITPVELKDNLLATCVKHVMSMRLTHKTYTKTTCYLSVQLLALAVADTTESKEHITPLLIGHFKEP